MFQQPAARPNGQVHAEFRAGRMDWDQRTKMVTADKRKGKIVLYTSEEEQLMHFQWWDRDKNETVTDLIVINDAYLERIEKCTTGRVYLLRFTSSDKKMFFWMQEPKDEGDAELIKKFNDAIGATIPEKGSKPAAAPAAAASAPAAGAPAAAAGGAEVDPALRAILAQFLQSGGAAGGVPAANRTPPVPLTAVLTSDVLTPLMDDEAAKAEMMPLLPESHNSAEGLRQVLTSPQLQQSLVALSQAVHSDQLAVLFASLGLDPSAITRAAPGSDALEVLCKAMEDQYKNK
eukprot:TRINITY_DN94034_c0_g1_i1.p1 TRINITY_DN94034_c0_g1~~TRINITY_DN94034_c0_g1_i1.p1  ORF type:complete len:289 (+),score=106.42 TRINITY_DN94034_c0_g1_i1:113-979(+)